MQRDHDGYRRAGDERARFGIAAHQCSVAHAAVRPAEKANVHASRALPNLSDRIPTHPDLPHCVLHAIVAGNQENLPLGSRR